MDFVSVASALAFLANRYLGTREAVTDAKSVATVPAGALPSLGLVVAAATVGTMGWEAAVTILVLGLLVGAGRRWLPAGSRWETLAATLSSLLLSPELMREAAARVIARGAVARGGDDKLIAALQEDEGTVREQGLHVLYKCTANALTIGWGHNLGAAGLCDEAMLAQLRHDLALARAVVAKLVPSASPPLRDGLALMAFQLGESRMVGFKRALRCAAAGDVAGFCDEIRHSAWNEQTPRRVERVIRVVQGGE